MAASSNPALWWVRRDLRLADNPALQAAIDEGEAVLPLFVLDPVLLGSAGRARRGWLFAALHALDADLQEAGGPGLSVVQGRPAAAVTRAARACGARTVHISADFAPYGRRRDERVAAALAEHGIGLRATGSPYAVAPGTLTNGGTTPFQVFSPFHRSWLEHGVHEPAPAVAADAVNWLKADDRVPLEEPDLDLAERAGEQPARRSWQTWLDKDPEGVKDYDRLHNFPGRDATSHLSIALRWGHLHPRTVLADLATRRSKGSLALARQIAWRDFYADTLFHRPDAVTQPIKPEFRRMPSDEPEPGSIAAERLAAWQQGRTGYPLVDAGMRQLQVESWMHNRVRMVVASFLIKDLHISWEHGAAYFMLHLRDGDIAQNHLNWQWVAGCGTDPAPYFRIFNPVKQSATFDADGSYIRRYVPELADVPEEFLHEPWRAPGGVPVGYPAPIVDHGAERKRALDRYAVVTG
jgi:deoxyribodipyrimidine photo-lyase